MSIVETRDLTKHYGRTFAVRELNIQVAAGEIYGFLGLNGAGKSTTIRMLLGMTRPSRGTARLFGRAIARAPWKRVGYLVDGAHAYPGMTVRENLELSRRLYGVTDRGATDRVLEQLGLGTLGDRRAGTLSQGNAQRLGLARTLLHRPELLILDEPANALDPAGIVELRELLATLAREHGVAILVSSHILAEVARLATRIGIIDHGQLLTELDPSALRGRERLVLTARDRRAAGRALRDGGFQVRELGERLELTEPPAVEHPDQIASLLVGAGAPPTSLHVEREDLEALFLRLIAEHHEAAA